MTAIYSRLTPKQPVSAAVTARITEILAGDTRIFGTPGASLTWGIQGSANADVSAGLEGEKQTAKILAEYVEKYDDTRIFHSVKWPGSKGDTDHMIVFGNNVIIVDSKRWMSQRKYSVTAKGSILRGTVAFPEGKVKMIPALGAWREQLPKGTHLRGVVCVAQEKVFVPYDNNWYKSPFKLVTAEKLIEFLDSYRERQKSEDINFLDTSIVTPIMTNLIKARNRRAELINLDAMKR